MVPFHILSLTIRDTLIELLGANELVLTPRD